MEGPKGEKSYNCFMRLGILPILAAGVIAAACALGPADGTKEKDSQPVGLAILDYHALHCEKCHGVEGELHTLGWTKEKSEDELLDILFQMVTSYSGQPRMTPLHEQAFASMHRANGQQEPWGSLIEVKTGTLVFESVKDAKLEAELLGTSLKIERTEAEVKGLTKKMLRWVAALPEGSDWRQVTVTLTQGEGEKQKKVSWQLKESSFSHWKKLPATGGKD